MKKRLVVGILAHVDSGKTTLSEGLLYGSGDIKKLGRVDHGNAFLDSFALERDRGITIFSKQASLRIEETEITLLDTPGHVDFSPEMERTLQVLDYAILVINGTDGVQSHTETLWRLLVYHKIPTFIFVNKMDLPGADKMSLMRELKRRICEGCIDFGEENESLAIWENIAVYDETLFDEFIETGEIADDGIASIIKKRRIFPCYFGSALKLQGVNQLLKGLQRYTESRIYSKSFGAKVFKIARDEDGARLTYMKITGGSLRVKDQITCKMQKSSGWGVEKSGLEGKNSDVVEKINQIRIYSGARFVAVDEVPQGTICAVTGLSKTYPGQGIGVESDSEVFMLSPVLTYTIGLTPEQDAHTVISKLKILEEEEPQLHVAWDELHQKINVELMGEVQMEVLKRLISERFQMNVCFGQGQIVYKETIKEEVEGIGHFEPLRHYAEVHLLLTPGDQGSGISICSDCSYDVLDKNWQRLILSALEEKTHIGVLTGSAITDLKITLVTGKAHDKHTDGGDFREAACRAVRQGLRQTKNILLEPWYNFRLEIPISHVGHAMSDLQRMNGKFEPPEVHEEFSVINGSAPVRTLMDYQTEVRGYTGGRGKILCNLRGYEPCQNQEEVIAAIGYEADRDLGNPSDSIFCDHGSGFTVKWDKVKNYMHVDSNLFMRTEEYDLKDRIIPSKVGEYGKTISEDEELAAIFERTYGPVRRDFKTVLENIRNVYKEETDKISGGFWGSASGTEYLLVDGYNIIFSWDDLSKLAQDNLYAARSRLIDILCNFQGFCQCEVILVFDAYKVRGNPGTFEKINNISVVYTKEAETADMYIEKAAHKMGKDYRVRVATSDGMEQLIVLSKGAIRVSAAAFREEVDAVEKKIRSFLK